jgi:hypothetical protein
MFQPPPEDHPMMSEHEPSPPPPQYTYIQTPFQRKDDDFLESVSKQTLVLVFAAFFIGLLLGKSMTPVVLRQG